MVMTFHLGYRAIGSSVERNLFPWGVDGVTVFFVISGFLITYLLCEEERKTNHVSLKGFYNRRAFRILPPVLIYLVAVAPLSSGTDILHCLLFIRNFFPGKDITGHFWTLSVEEQFYLFWPALFIVLRNNHRRLVAGVSIIVVMLAWNHLAFRIVGADNRWFNGTLKHDAIIVSIKLIFGHFPILTGCCLALLRQENLLRWRWVTSHLAAVCFAIAFCAALKGILPYSVMVLLIAGIINYSVSQDRTFLDWEPLAWIGRLSYSLYIWQEPFTWKSPLGIFGSFPLNVVASFLLAMASYYGVEKTALRFRDRLKAKRIAEGDKNCTVVQT
jgi:peptidoglycan/LPS O-acetylase OafA/YrhL